MRLEYDVISIYYFIALIRKKAVEAHRFRNLFRVCSIS